MEPCLRQGRRCDARTRHRGMLAPAETSGSAPRGYDASANVTAPYPETELSPVTNPAHAGVTPLVSVITPNHNGAHHLAATYRALAAQTIDRWQWLVVDDHSTDLSVELVECWADSDHRIRLLRTPSNLGAGPARNLGVAASEGRYVAFLDADDVWEPTKLQQQLAFMSERGSSFTFTSFRYMPLDGGDGGVVAEVPSRLDYRAALKNTAILTSTVVLDGDAIPKAHIRFPPLRRGQDTALWWALLREYGPAAGLQLCLTGYRQDPSSLSASRGTALRRTWVLYREVERLSLPQSVWYFGHYAANALRRRRGRVRVTGQ